MDQWWLSSLPFLGCGNVSQTEGESCGKSRYKGPEEINAKIEVRSRNDRPLYQCYPNVQRNETGTVTHDIDVGGVSEEHQDITTEVVAVQNLKQWRRDASPAGLNS